MVEQLVEDFGNRAGSSATGGRDGEKRPAMAVVGAIAAAGGTDHTEIPPLYESIDPDALNRLFGDGGQRSDPNREVCFTHDGWHVHVRGDGRILVRDDDTVATRNCLGHKATGD